MSSQPAQQRSTTMVTTGEATLMILVASSLVVLVIIVLYFRAKYSRATVDIDDDEHSPPARRPLVFAPDSSGTARARRCRRPLDPSVLNALQVSVFPSEDFKPEGGAECAVCLSEFAGGEEARLLPGCGHGFHVECIDMWFLSNSTCPLCRLPVALASSAEPTVDSPACVELVGSKTVGPESCVVNIDEASSSSSSSWSSSSNSSSYIYVNIC